MRTKANGAKYMKEASSGVKPFRTAVKRAALGHDGLPMRKFIGPVIVSIEFEFLQAKSNTDVYPVGQNVGDIDKLTRAVLDALKQAGVIEDDRFVVALKSVTKTWGPEDYVTITVREAPTLDTLAQSVVDFSSDCRCDRITCRQCSARRGVLPARLDESGPPRFLPMEEWNRFAREYEARRAATRNPFEH